MLKEYFNHTSIWEIENHDHTQHIYTLRDHDQQILLMYIWITIKLSYLDYALYYGFLLLRVEHYHV